jgi:hypothetical protein
MPYMSEAERPNSWTATAVTAGSKRSFARDQRSMLTALLTGCDRDPLVARIRTDRAGR